MLPGLLAKMDAARDENGEFSAGWVLKNMILIEAVQGHREEVLEVIIDQDAGVYPMVGPGLAYDQMITGDFIPNRHEPDEDESPDGSSMF